MLSVSTGEPSGTAERLGCRAGWSCCCQALRVRGGRWLMTAPRCYRCSCRCRCPPWSRSSGCCSAKVVSTCMTAVLSPLWRMLRVAPLRVIGAAAPSGLEAPLDRRASVAPAITFQAPTLVRTSAGVTVGEVKNAGCTRLDQGLASGGDPAARARPHCHC
jgi:hypothetical protein